MTLCAHHREVVARLAAMDHVGDEESTRAATCLARQCPHCATPPAPPTREHQ